MSNEQFVVIGDLHGCFESLQALMNKLDSYSDRTFIFVGDYIDRGPKSKEVVDYLLTLREEIDCIFLRGNHEQMLIDAIANKRKTDFWLRNGGAPTLESYGLTRDEINLPKEHRRFFEDTLMYYSSDDYFFVHAGLPPDKTIRHCLSSEYEMNNVLWERSHLNAFETSWEKIVIFGHTPRPRPLKRNQMIGIDTGCVYDRIGYGKLTAVTLPEEEFVQQICLD